MGIYVYPNNTETEITNLYVGIPNPESITLDKSSISLTTVGQTVQLTATLSPTPCDQRIIWTTTNHTVATVSTTGLVTCVTPGTCTITAITVNGLTASCNVGTGPRLPVAYQEVEWIGSSGNQYIDTSFTPSYNTKLDFQIFDWSQTGSYQMCGYTGNWWSSTPNAVSIVTDNYKFGILQEHQHGLSDGQAHHGVLSKDGFYVDDVLIQVPSTSTFTCAGNMVIFATRNSGNVTEYATLKVKSFIIYENDVEVRNFVPCYRKADSVIGMYDLINGVFYTNAGSGTFTKGSDV